MRTAAELTEIAFWVFLLAAVIIGLNWSILQ